MFQRNHSLYFAPDKDAGSADDDSQADASVTDEVVDESTDSTSSKPSGNQTPDPSEWKGKYQGMVKEYDRYKKKAEGEIAAYKAQLVEKDAQLSSLTGEKIDFETKHTTSSKENEVLKNSLTTKMAEAESAQKQVARMKLIANKFPALMRFEANNLLPQGDNDEDLEVKLTAFQTGIKDLAGKTASDMLAGSSPTADSSNTSNDTYDEDTLWAKITALSSTGLRTPEQLSEYNSLMAKWDTLQAQKGKK